jgi:hypothetical protein
MAMMMTTIRKGYFVLFCFFLPLVAFSQEKDFGLWFGVSAEHKLAKKLELDISTNVRTFNKTSKIEEAFIEGGIVYSIMKNLSVAGSYRLTDKIEDNNSYYFQHKVFLDLKGNLPIGHFSFNGRLRFQARTKTYIEDDNDNHPDYTGRLKIKVTYKTQTFPLDPYIYAESFCPMFSDMSGTIGKNRFAAGLELSIANRHSVEAEYIFQRDYLPHISDINIISVNYNIRF